MPWPAIITGAAKLAGGLFSSKAAGAALIGGGASLLGGYMANEASARQAEINREFQDQLSRTAHQREVADLRAAGLNPILSGTGGHGASTPSGAMAQQSDMVTPAVGSAFAAKRLDSELDLLREQTVKTASETDQNMSQTELNNRLAREAESRVKVQEAQERNINFDTGLKAWGMARTESEREQIRAQTRLHDAMTRLRDIETEIAGYSAVGAKVEADIDRSRYGIGLRYTNRAAAAASGITNAYRAYSSRD